MPPEDLEAGAESQTPGVLSKGFSAVASKIAADPDKTTTIYRRFDKLSARNLLFYQAELAELESQQEVLDNEDRRAIDEYSDNCQRDWRWFEEGAKVEGRERRKMNLAMRVRHTLEKYYEALAAHQKLLNNSPPAEMTVKAMKNWFFSNSARIKPKDQRIPQLWGASQHNYADRHDLLALRVPADQDALSNFILNNLGFLFQNEARENSTAYVSEHHIYMFIAVLSTILASVLLFGSIISLYIVKNPHALLGMLSGWTVVFAACVGLLTNAKRDQIFAATAAYAAVLVVFISGDLGGAAPSDCICSPS